MTTLNEAESVRYGSQVVSRIYVGSELVWPTPRIPGLTLWYDASSLAEADGAAVNSWANLVVGGPALSLVSSPAPVKRANAVNGLSVVRFTTGQGGFQQASLTGIDREHTLLVVARQRGTANGRVLGADSAKLNHLVGWWSGTENSAYMEGWFSGSPGPAATTNWRLYATDGTDLYPAAVLADAPIAYYRMNELLGTVATDSSGNNCHGTYSGGPTFNLVAPTGTGLSFDGVDDLVLFPASVAIPPNSSITVEWWQYVATAAVVNSSAFNIGDNAASNFVNCHAPWSDQNIYWDYGTQTNGRISTSYAGQLNKWTLIHLTYDAATGRRAISFDGVEAASRVDAAAPTSTRTAGGIIGSQGAKYVDEFAVYLTALTTTRRLAHYNARVPSLRLFGNGTLLGTGGTQGWVNTFTINQYASERSDCEVAEVVAYNRKLPTVERQMIESYLRNKWGIT